MSDAPQKIHFRLANRQPLCGLRKIKPGTGNKRREPKLSDWLGDVTCGRCLLLVPTGRKIGK